MNQSRPGNYTELVLAGSFCLRTGLRMLSMMMLDIAQCLLDI